MLDGLLVLDLSRVLAGPYATQMLADLGATVVKLEPPGGDDTRAWGPPWIAGPVSDGPDPDGRGGTRESAYFWSVNRGKRSIALDLKTPGGRRAARALAARADVLVESFRTGVMARLGLDPAELREANPGLVIASVSGYGRTGPRAAEPGYDAALQAGTGLMAMTGEPDGAPVKLGVAWIDVLTGTHLAVGILAALRERDRTGRGADLDLSLMETALASMVNQAQGALLTGEAPPRRGSAHPSIVPYQAFEAADGALVIAVGNDAQWGRLIGALGDPSWARDPALATNEGRVARRDRVVAGIAEIVRGRPKADWLERLEGAGVPASSVDDLPTALAGAQVAARGLVRESFRPDVGAVPSVGSPFGPERTSELPPPALGAHGPEVLREQLGWSDDEIEALVREGALRAPDQRR